MAASPFITFSAITQKLPNNPRPSLSHFSSHHITSIILLTIPTNFPSISHFIFTLLSLSSSSEMLAFAWSLWAKLTATGESPDPALPVVSKSEPSKPQVVVVRQPCAVPPCAVPPSLPQIEPILRVAEEVKRINPRVGYLCRFYALEKSHRLDPTTCGEGVRTFKTLLVVQLDKEHVSSLRVRKKKSDELEILCFYQQYYRNYIQALKNAVTEADFANLAKDYQTVYVLYEVWKSLQLPKTTQDREEMLVRMIERATNEVTGVRRSNEVPIVRPPPSPTPLPQLLTIKGSK